MIVQWIRRLAGRFRRSKTEIVPKQIRLEASSFCQLRCPSCPTTSGAINPVVGKGFLRFADFRSLIERNPSIERVELSNYGEAFLNPELIQILEYAHHAGVKIVLENGANFNHVDDAVLEALVKYQVAALTCSIDGASAETYRRYRVRGDFDAVIRNIRKLNVYKGEFQSEYPQLFWQFIVFGHNEHEIPAARRLAQDLGMQFGAKLTWDNKFSPIRDRQLVATQLGDDVASRAEYEKEYGRKYLSGICLQLWDHPQINWDGRVLGCCRNFWGEFGGNAFTDGLTNVLNGEKIAYARQMLKGLAPPRDDIPCTSCEMYRGMQEYSNYITGR